MYELFEHTADLGLQAEAATLNELFADAGLGLSSMIVEDVTAGSAPRRTVLRHRWNGPRIPLF